MYINFYSITITINATNISTNPNDLKVIINLSLGSTLEVLRTMRANLVAIKLKETPTIARTIPKITLVIVNLSSKLVLNKKSSIFILLKRVK